MSFFSLFSFNKKVVYATLVVIGVIGCCFFVTCAKAQSSKENESSLFTIYSGQGIVNIANDLYQSSLISSRWLFATYSLLTGHGKQFQAGVYKIEKGTSAFSVAKLLAQGPPQVRVVIPPGSTIKEIDGLLSREKIVGAGMILQLTPKMFAKDYPFLYGAPSLEGFLFPDTYLFYLGTDSTVVAKALLDNFKEKTANLFLGMNADAIYKKVVLASLAEKEVISDADRRLVIGVINRRLALHMALQIDAAVAYGACDGVFDDCDEFSRNSFKKDTPYNTYLNKGLPPTPISNPSLSSLIAAVHPTATSYLYYLSDPKTKKTFFAKTLDEHAANIEKYLR